MPDIIQLLSDHIANQIAAGEVIQRPASAVKELMENAIDAGASEIQLVIKDAGKELIQVIDNGKGMSPTDARMSFERHATSKIRNINDLFTIRTMGFRGEALASIAAVAQVELKTRQAANETGTRILIEGSEVKLQEPCVVNPGTNISLKNLFYNVPARRNFLKSANAEFRHILEEFTRIALAYPAIAFRLINNGTEQYHLTSGSLKARVVGLLGNNYEKKIVPAEEKTDLINITGFVGKPDAAARTRGMQYFFINNRFIKNAYLNHAVVKAYEGLIDKESFPFYVLFLEVDPARVDVNVHPTKQEVKFEDDQLIYSYLNAAVKHALARYNIAPSLDFTLSPEIQHLTAVNRPQNEERKEQTQNGYLYNVFTDRNQAHVVERKDSLREWKSLYEIAQNPTLPPMPDRTQPDAAPASWQQPVEVHLQGKIYSDTAPAASTTGNMLLIHGDLLATPVKSGLMVVNIRRAQERIIFERLQEQVTAGKALSQQVLFPASFTLPPQDAILLQELLPDLQKIGFNILPAGDYTFTVAGTPPDMQPGDERNVIDEALDQLKNEAPDAVGNRARVLLANMARRLARNIDSMAQPENQQALIDELFACGQPEYSPSGKKVFFMLRTEHMEEMLG